jgi:CubicO group peptidase (beta-lactamase class C family)
MKSSIVILLCTCFIFACAQGAIAADDDSVRSIDPFLQKYFRNRESCMVVGLVDDQGKQIFSAGQLDNGSDHAVDGDTLFFIGSVSKTFTALLFQQMVEQGELKPDDPVAKYLPEPVKPPTRDDKPITLLNLATHSAGLPTDPDNMGPGEVRRRYESYTVEKMEAFLSSYTPPRDPGAEFEYSNVGMSLLGEALSRHAGKGFESLLVERICKPLGMESTCITPTSQMQSRLAMGHEKNGDRSTPFKLQAYIPAGGVHSTANDLLKYAAAQAGLTQSVLTQAIEKTHVIRYTDTRGLDGVPGMGSFGQTAMDWVDRGALQPPGTQLLGHAGGAGSYHAFVGFDMKQHRGVVVLSTDNDLSVEAVGWTLLQHKPLTEQSYKDFEREMVGIGVALDLDKETKLLRITRVFPNSPAARGGLSADCLIKRIDDVSLEGKSLLACTKLLRGNVGTKVMLEFLDPQGKSNTVELTRQKFFISQS